jgi:hypothetical protein
LEHAWRRAAAGRLEMVVHSRLELEIRFLQFVVCSCLNSFWTRQRRAADLVKKGWSSFPSSSLLIILSM